VKNSSAWLFGALAAVIVVSAVLFFTSPDREDADAHAPAQSGGGEVDYIVAGGGSTPESNEYSIEQDLVLADSVLRGAGLTLYAAGADTAAVRVTKADATADSLRIRLGQIFNPRVGRTSTYRKTILSVDEPATPRAFYGAIADAGTTAGDGLDVYVAGHGDRGDVAAENAVVWWGNRVVTPRKLAAQLAEIELQRDVRFVMTTCFSGGFAELVFENADETAGVTEQPICGLFASTWDREAGGCDPDPDRGVHEGYGVHFLSALKGESTDGAAIDRAIRDYDGDSKTGFLDAHTYARLHSESIDVPTTTSERFLRSVVDPATQTGGRAGLLPHEDAVIEALSAQLEVGSEAESLERARTLDTRIEAQAKAETDAATRETDAYWKVAAAMLARWPVLDDPWHPQWQATIDEHGEEIWRFLDERPEVAALGQAMAATDRASGKRADLEAERAPYDRLLRAYETRRLATALKDRGGAGWKRFERFRTCESGG
jgi:hypothetical protein